MKIEKTLSEMTTETVETFKNYPKTGTPTWTYETAVKDLPYQIGSLTKLVMQMNGERFSDNKSDEQLRFEITDELADILSLVLFIAHELNIDIHEAWNQMTESDKRKINERSV